MKHIGNFILNHFALKNIAASDVARNIGMTRTGFYKLLSKNDMTLSRLSQISMAVNHNFFHDYYTHSHTGEPSYGALLTENQQLKEKLSKLQTEVTILKEIIQPQKLNTGQTQ